MRPNPSTNETPRQTPLQLAIEAGDLGRVESLLGKGANVNEDGGQIAGPFRRRKGIARDSQALVAKGADLKP